MRTKSRLRAARERGQSPRVEAVTPSSTSFTLSLFDMVKQLLTSHPAWQVRDIEGRWVCPYCCEPTGHEIVDGQVGTEMLRGIARSVMICTAFDDRWPLSFRTVDEVLEGAAATIRRQQLAEKVADATQRFSVWHVIDPDDCWVCPYCCASVGLVEFDEDGPNPHQVALHLYSHCEAYGENEEPARTSLELWERAGLTEQVPTLSELRAVETQLRERNERRNDEMKRAAEQQRSMMATPPSLPGLEFAVHYEPGQYLANGFYDFIDLRNGRTAIIVGEVRGSGLDAALVVGVCKKVISITAKSARDPIEALVESNEELFEDLGGTTDVALTYALLDAPARTLTFVRAGGEPPLILRPSADALALAHDPMRRGAPLGAVRGSLFSEALASATIDLLPGDVVLFFTGAASGARCPERNLYGRRRLSLDLAELGELGVSTAVAGIAQRLAHHVQGAEDAPDQCVIGLGVSYADLGDSGEYDSCELDPADFDIDDTVGVDEDEGEALMVDLAIMDDDFDLDEELDDVILGPITLSDEYAVQIRDETRDTIRRL